MMFLADRKSRKSIVKTINGGDVTLVATQVSTRTKRKRTVYVYHIAGTKIIVYNRSKYGIMFMRMALKAVNANRYYDIFVNRPLTEAEQIWLDRYGYVLN